MLEQIFGSSSGYGFLSPEGEKDGAAPPVLKCADGDLCRFGTSTVEKKHQCTRGCGGYLHSAFCGVPNCKKRYINKTSYKTHMCQKCTAQLGLCQLVYASPINTYNKESNSNVDNHDESNNKTRSSNRILRNNAAKMSEMKTKKSVGDSLIPIAHVVQENQSNQDEDENLVNNDNNGMQVGVVYQKPYFSQK
jgi:hypothetical protein